MLYTILCMCMCVCMCAIISVCIAFVCIRAFRAAKERVESHMCCAAFDTCRFVASTIACCTSNTNVAPPDKAANKWTIYVNTYTDAYIWICELRNCNGFMLYVCVCVWAYVCMYLRCVAIKIMLCTSNKEAWRVTWMLRHWKFLRKVRCCWNVKEVIEKEQQQLYMCIYIQAEA